MHENYTEQEVTLALALGLVKPDELHATVDDLKLEVMSHIGRLASISSLLTVRGDDVGEVVLHLNGLMDAFRLR